MICGASGTGKYEIAKWAEADGFELIDEKVELDQGRPFVSEINFATSRLISQLRAAQLMNRKNIVTIRSFWDSAEVFLPILEANVGLSKDERDIFDMIKNAMYAPGVLPPPSIVVMAKTSKMNAFDRMNLRGVTIDQEHYNQQLDFYERMAEKIAAPLIELNMDEKVEIQKKNFDYGMASIRAANLSAQSLWQKSFFR
jgi:deoxyadenosine/deoxycytidine kinase